jgi:hypothetical protein
MLVLIMGSAKMLDSSHNDAYILKTFKTWRLACIPSAVTLKYNFFCPLSVCMYVCILSCKLMYRVGGTCWE